MRRRLIVSLIILNGLVATVLVATPAVSQVIPLGLFNCCNTEGPEAYCCASCCWFIWNCRFDKDCELEPMN